MVYSVGLKDSNELLYYSDVSSWPGVQDRPGTMLPLSSRTLPGAQGTKGMPQVSENTASG